VFFSPKPLYPIALKGILVPLNQHTHRDHKMNTYRTHFEVTVELKDDLTGKTVTRVIDDSNLMVNNGETAYLETNPEKQLELLKKWVTERANAQHETSLSVVSWYLKHIAAA